MLSISGFLCVMVLYPRLSTLILSALRCRTLGPDLSVLDVDYTVTCAHSVEGLAWLMVFVVPVGIPVGLLGLSGPENLLRIYGDVFPIKGQNLWGF